MREPIDDKLALIGSRNGMVPHQSVVWANAWRHYATMDEQTSLNVLRVEWASSYQRISVSYMNITTENHVFFQLYLLFLSL